MRCGGHSLTACILFYFIFSACPCCWLAPPVLWIPSRKGGFVAPVLAWLGRGENALGFDSKNAEDSDLEVQRAFRGGGCTARDAVPSFGGRLASY